MDMTTYRKIDAAKTDMLKHLNEGMRQWKNTACIAIVFEGNHHISPNQACHAGLHNNYDGNHERGALAVVSGLMKPSEKEMLDEDEAILFLDWLLNRSPYSETFITKSPYEALLTKTIVSSAHHPSNLMAAGLVASRRLWEYVNVARVFCDLAKVGVNEDLAFYLGHIFSGTFNREGNVSYGACTAGHCSINPGVMGDEELKNFLEHKPVKLNKTYHEYFRYTGYDSMYGNSTNTVRKWIHDNFPYKGPVAADKKVNPFGRDPGVGAASCTYDHLIKTTVEFQHLIFERIGFKQEAKKEAA
jgi:hypothetical protein